MQKHEILSVARAEYKQAVEWYAERSPTAAERFVNEVESAIEAICRNPDEFPRWGGEYRFYLLKKFRYFVAYRQMDDLIVIVAIRHAAQDQDAWKGR